MNKLFWVRVKEEGRDENYGMVERIELSTGEVVEYDHDENKIDLTKLQSHRGERLEWYRNGELHAVKLIDDVSPNDERDGIMTLWMKDLPEEKDSNEI